MTDIVERLYEMADDITYELAAQEITRLRAEIAMLRADLLKAEMKAEIADAAEVARLVAIGRREGIEACAALVGDLQLPHPDTGTWFVDGARMMRENARRRIRALLEGGR